MANLWRVQPTGRIDSSDLYKNNISNEVFVLATNEFFGQQSSVNTITANIVGLLGTVSSTATTTTPQYDISGDISGYVGTVSSTATSTVPQYTITSSITGVPSTVSGNITTSTEQYNITGNIIGILGEISASLQSAPPSIVAVKPTELVGGNSGGLNKRLKRIQQEDEEIIYVLKIFLNGKKELL
jgi:hypothetical protein